MLLLENCPLEDRHTFHLQAKTRYWVDFQSTDELKNLLWDSRFSGMPVLPVGGGSNLLFTHDFPGVVFHSTICTIEPIRADASSVWIRVGSGVVWDDWVAYAVGKEWGGVENLSGIPGEVGASPVQNVGAYGAEAGDTITEVEALDLESHNEVRFTNEECRFGYRDSIFKHEWKGRFIVCYVTFKLSKSWIPNIEYGDLAGRVRDKGKTTLSNVRQAVLDIRSEKLPDPAVVGNAGSFFMNPEIPEDQYQGLKRQWPDIPGWPQENGRVKISAAWCIDQAGWKGKSLGSAAVHNRQALVLINPGRATASDVKALAERIMQDVKEKFGVELFPEVLFV